MTTKLRREIEKVLDDLQSKHIRSHYNFVTDAWKFILGKNLHLGFFNGEKMNLQEATDALIEEMASLADFKADSSVLDVGCGIGEPAFFLHKKFGCSVVGISNSEKGVEEAQEESRSRGYEGKVTFKFADALKNGLPDESFDIIWLMESSHLMWNKLQLFRECYRVLKCGGVMLLCDVILKRNVKFTDYFVHNTNRIVMQNVFGFGRLSPLPWLKEKAVAAGFSDVTFRDISDEAFPSINYWRKNVTENEQEISKVFSENDSKKFLRGCDVMETLFRRNVIGYGLLKARKISS